MMEYLVQSLKSRKKFQENNHILNLVEIKPNEVILFVQDLVDAFMPVMATRGLKIGIENMISLSDNKDHDRGSEMSSALGKSKQMVLIADWYLYQLTLFHLIYSA